MYIESANTDPEGPLGPLASQWVADLVNWYERLQKHFKFDRNDLAKNVRSNFHKWRTRLNYLKDSNPQLYRSLMVTISEGHSIPFVKEPQKYFRKHNPKSLAADRVRAWAAVMGDIKHGAISPVNLQEEGLPRCVCPVRTADKSDGSARFVHNTRHVNKYVDAKDAECELETLMRTRNLYICRGLLVGSDYSSGYHCIYVDKKHTKYLAFALHLSELSEEAATWLWEHYPCAFHQAKRCFVFKYLVLPFGLCTSCRIFNSLIAALMGFWRRCRSGCTPTRVSSYIDDIVAIQKRFRDALRLSIRMVFEAASLGLSLKIKKCSYFPRHAMVTLGTVVDLTKFEFRVSRRRAEKIKTTIVTLQAAINSNPLAVPAKLIASMIGLIWSISCCCHRAAGVMTRSIIAVLSRSMRVSLRSAKRPLKSILAAF